MFWFRVVLCSYALPLIAADQSPQIRFSRLFANGTQDFIAASSSDAAGNLYVAGIAYSPGFPLLNPIQKTGPIFLSKFDPAGAMVYSTRLGESVADSVGGMAVDDAGNAWLTGSTIRNGMPDAYVMKVDSEGQRILYSTRIGGAKSDLGMALAVDRQGNAYVAGSTESEDFAITAGSLGGEGSAGIWVVKFWKDGGVLYSYGLGRAQYPTVKIAVSVAGEPAILVTRYGGYPYIAKVNAAGTSVAYRVTPRGAVNAIAMDAIGYVWTAGSNSALEAATAGAAQARPGTASYYRSSDGGVNWKVGASGLDGSAVYQIASDSGRGDLYAATLGGLYRSKDGGGQWTRALDGAAYRIAIGADAIYVSHRGESPIVKSMDGGATWQDVAPPGMSRTAFAVLALDPSSPSTVLAAADRVYRSDDAGATWNASESLHNSGILSMAVDPSDPSVVYVGAPIIYNHGGFLSIPLGGGLMRSTDGGRTFQTLGISGMLAILPDPAAAGTAYAAGDRLYRSTDFGEHWLPLNTFDPGWRGFNALAFDPAGALSALRGDGRIVRSFNGGDTFDAVGEPFPVYGAQTFGYDSEGGVHVGGSMGANAFVSKLDLSGNVAYATYWGGRMSDEATSVAVDGAGSVYVGGWTASPDFPERNTAVSAPQGSDAFVLKLDAAGAVVYSTSVGGSGADQGVSVAASAGGQAYLSGVTGSLDFPGSGGVGKAVEGTRSLFVVGLRQ